MRVLGARLASALALCAALAGCQSVMWYGRTPDRSADARVVASGDEQRVVVGGAAHPAFAAIALETLAFDRSGRVAYAARDARGWSIVVDGRVASPAFERVSWVGWSASPGTVLAVIGDRSGDRVLRLRPARGAVFHAATGPRVDAVATGSVVSTPGGHVGFVGFRGASAHVVVDDEVGPAWDGVARLRLAPDGAPSFLARRDGSAWVVRRGRLGGPLLDVADLAFDGGAERAVALVRSEAGWHADDGTRRSRAYDQIADLRVAGTRHAFRASRGDDVLVVVDGTEQGPFLHVRPGTLQIGGASGDRVAFVATDAQGERAVVDGARLPAWSEVTELVLADDGHVAFVARDGGAFHVVRDGVPGRAFSRVADLRLGRGGRAVFTARAEDRDVVVEGDTVIPVPGLVAGTLRFAADGSTWGVLVEDGAGFALASRAGLAARLDLEEMLGELLRRRDPAAQEEVLRGWLAAELERVARTPPRRRPD